MKSDRSDAKLAPPTFKSTDLFSFSQFDVVLTTLDRDSTDLGHLVGRVVVVDGVEFSCIGARASTRAPYKKGTDIVLQILPV